MKTIEAFKSIVLQVVIISIIVLCIVNRINFAIGYTTGTLAYLTFLYFYNFKTLRPVRNYRNKTVVDFQGRSERQQADNEKMGCFTMLLFVVVIISIIILHTFKIV